jgi:hypothetical protein
MPIFFNSKTELNGSESLILFKSVRSHAPVSSFSDRFITWPSGRRRAIVPCGVGRGKQQLLLFIPFQTRYYLKEGSTEWHCISPAGKSAALLMGSCEHGADIVPQWPEWVNALSRSSHLQRARIGHWEADWKGPFLHCDFNDRSSLLWSKLTHQIMHSENWITNPLTCCRLSAKEHSTYHFRLKLNAPFLLSSPLLFVDILH